MDERDDHSRGGRLLWVTATGLVVSFIGIGYSAVYAPEMRQRMADAIGSAAQAGTAPASSESTNDISVSVSVPPDIAFMSGAGRVEAVETSGIAIHDRRRGPAVPVPASAPTGSIETTSVPAAATRSGPIPVTASAPVALADAQGRDRKLPDTSISIVLLPPGTPPPEATAPGPTTLTSDAHDDQVDGRETGSARGSSAAASSSGSGQNSSSASGSGNTAASGNGSGANSGTGSGQSSSGTNGSQSTGSQGGSTQGGVAGAAGDTVGAAADAAKGAVGGALGAVDHAAGGVLGGGGGGGVLGKK
jgi:hypothetical protein